ncbi:MAG: rhodanese-like domain-containing protein [Chloroflexi bacterium]|nr:rhodanese-like domain-containing protein [Chloroflexota bacterium]
MEIRQFVDEGLGNSAHLVISERTGVAALVDPLRSIEPYLDAAAAAGVRITHVLETHLHSDFLSGSRELAARTGARVCASASAGLEFEHQPLHDGDILEVGDLRIQVLATPGHTPEHISFVVSDVTIPDQPPVLFSGGSLLVGAVARTDLLGHEHTVGLAQDLYRSLHEKILRLPDAVQVFPTHGAGSFCTAAPGGERQTTIGRERQFNPYLHVPSAPQFAQLMAGAMPSYPTYFRHMAAINRRGPRVIGSLPDLAPLAPAEVAKRQDRGDAVVDLRSVADYLSGHVPGAYQVELRSAFASWVGWVVPFGTPIILVSSTPSAHGEAVRQLVVIGYDNLSGYLDGGMAAWERAGLSVARTQVLTVAEVRQRVTGGGPILVLDIRQNAEWEAGHIPGAVHVEGGILAEQGATLPQDRLIAVHCGHEPRAATALSVLERLGYQDLRLVRGGFGAWEQAEFPVERPAAAAPTASKAI